MKCLVFTSALKKTAIFGRGAEPGGYLDEVPTRIAVLRIQFFYLMPTPSPSPYTTQHDPQSQTFPPSPSEMMSQGHIARKYATRDSRTWMCHEKPEIPSAGRSLALSSIIAARTSATHNARLLSSASNSRLV